MALIEHMDNAIIDCTHTSSVYALFVMHDDKLFFTYATQSCAVSTDQESWFETSRRGRGRRSQAIGIRCTRVHDDDCN